MSSVADGSVGLVMACCSLHWLDSEKFFREADRVLQPGGVLAVMGVCMVLPGPKVRNRKAITEATQKVKNEREWRSLFACI